MIKKIVLTIFASSSLLLLLFVVLNPSFASSAPFFNSKNIVTVYKNVQRKDLNENVLFDLVQTWRTKSDLPIYKKSERLCDVAAVRLKKVKVSFSHDGFIEQAVASDWYGYNGVAENLVRGFHSEQDSLDGWLGSPKHLENLEKPFTESCIKCDKNTCIHIFGGY